jgi:hypothetical protein
MRCKIKKTQKAPPQEVEKAKDEYVIDMLLLLIGAGTIYFVKYVREC